MRKQQQPLRNGRALSSLAHQSHTPSCSPRPCFSLRLSALAQRTRQSKSYENTRPQQLLGRTLYPDVRLPAGLSPAGVSRDEGKGIASTSGTRVRFPTLKL